MAMNLEEIREKVLGLKPITSRKHLQQSHI
jgi:hypothetical protein